MSCLFILDLVVNDLITSANIFTGFISISSPFLAIVKGDLEYPAITALNI